ncbi:TPA: phage tail protein I [Klebsiella oxytoca]
MTANYPASILPPNATAVERAIDRASAAALARLPVYLIRWVKDPDSCPLALLPWLAWEYQVDTWNVHWSEKMKRDAIKRAHYIHRHRGTVAAVRRALIDSPFGTDIVEWFGQNPKGDPYTFRLNVMQDDLPVSDLDHQDLKLAVMRAKNLRSWFSVHVFGRLQGHVYGAGWLYGVEKIGPRNVARITPEKTEIWVAPCQHVTVGVTITPPEVEDRTFTATPADNSLCRVEVSDESITVYGLDWGVTSITLTANEGGATATIRVNVVSATKITLEYNNALSPVFFTQMPESLLLAYGDEDPAQEFTPHQSVRNAFILSRDLEIGQRYEITFYSNDDVTFSNATTAFAVNTATKLHYLVSLRTDIDHIFYYHNGLEEIAENAIYLPKIQSMVNAFHSTGVSYPPDDFMAGDMPDLTDIEGLFRGSALRVLSAGFLRRAPNISKVYRAFAYVNFEKTPAGLFDACAENLARADWLFYQAKFPESDINDIFSAASYPNIGNIEYLAYMVTSLRGEGLTLVNKMQTATNTRMALGGATGLADYADIPASWKS